MLSERGLILDLPIQKLSWEESYESLVLFVHIKCAESQLCKTEVISGIQRLFDIIQSH